MNCERTQALLIAFVHDEVDPRLHRSICDHLSECRDCALEYTRLHLDLEGVWRAHASSPRPHVRDALRHRVEQTFSPWWRRAFRAWSRPVPAYGLVAALAIPLVVWGVLNPFRAPEAAELVEPRPRPVSPPAIADYDASMLTRIDPSVL